MKSNRTIHFSIIVLIALLVVIFVVIIIFAFKNNAHNKLLEAEKLRNDSIEMVKEAQAKMRADSIAKAQADSIAKAKADSIAKVQETQAQAEQLALIRKVMNSRPRGNQLKQYCTSSFWDSGEPVSFNDNCPGLYYDYDMVDTYAKIITAIGNNRVKVVFSGEELSRPITVIYTLAKENGVWKISGMRKQ